MASLQCPVFGSMRYDPEPNGTSGIYMDCGPDGCAQIHCQTRDLDVPGMLRDLMQTLEEWRTSSARIDTTDESGVSIKERPGTYRWWPRDRKEAAA